MPPNGTGKRNIPNKRTSRECVLRTLGLNESIQCSCQVSRPVESRKIIIIE